MVGIVIVSHSEKLAEGVKELALAMASDVKIAVAGGLEDGSLGTSFGKIKDAIDSVYSPDGVAVLLDMGSALLTTEMVIESLSDENIKIIDSPLVEGAALAAVEATSGTTLNTLCDRVKETWVTRKIV